MRANEKAKRQEERLEWEEIVKCWPIDASKEKEAVDLALSMPKKNGHVNYSEAAEALIVQGWPFGKCKTKFANQIRGWANRPVHAQQELAGRKRKAAAEDGEDGGGENGDVVPIPPRQQAVLAGSLHRYTATERVEKLTGREKCWRKELFDAL